MLERVSPVLRYQIQNIPEVEAVLINGDQYNTAAAEAVRPFLFEMLDFIADLHVLAKIKKETSSDSVGGDLKVRLAEVMASEMSRSNGRDCRTVIRFIPWLMSPPSVTQVKDLSLFCPFVSLSLSFSLSH